jgi:succinoglycan biosynthesis protein ExoA
VPDPEITVSVLIPVRDEQQHIREATRRMLEQELEGAAEFLFIDGGSRDSTRMILAGLQAQDGRIRLLDNPAQTTPQGLNIGLRHARGEFVARMDAHTYYPGRYLQIGIERLRRGGVDWVAGPQLARGVDAGSTLAARAISSRLGSGGAAFRRPATAEYDDDTGFTGVWRRQTLEAQGGWDEEWINDQDFELAARIRKDGGRIVCVPEMAAEYIPRSTLRALVRQYWRYGFYRVKTSRRHPESMRPSQLLPAGVALAAVAAVTGPRPVRKIARAGLAAYGALLVADAARQVPEAGVGGAAPLPGVLAAMHGAYGAGFMWACVRLGPPWAALRALARR